MHRKCLYLLFLPLLYGCPKYVEDCQARQSQDPSLLCTQQYEPVCGCNNTSYSNACVAESWGILQYTEGACMN